MEKQEKQKKWIIAGAVGFVILSLVIVLVAVISARRSAKLDILVVPMAAEVKVNGELCKNGVYDFEPGEVDVVISMEGFETKEGKMYLAAGETTRLYTYLLPEDGSYEWYLSHEEDMMLLNTIGDATASEDSDEYLKDNPIVEALPIVYANYDEELNYTEYRVDGGKFEGCEKEFCLKITDVTGGNRDAAMAKIRESGFEPNDYEIIYKYEPMEALE